MAEATIVGTHRRHIRRSEHPHYLVNNHHEDERHGGNNCSAPLLPSATHFEKPLITSDGKGGIHTACAGVGRAWDKCMSATRDGCGVSEIDLLLLSAIREDTKWRNQSDR